MDSRITLAFDKNVIDKAKAYAASQNISLSRLTEFLFRQITSGNYKTIDELPVSDWVNEIAEGQADYITKARSRKSLKQDFYDSHK
jgi:hypothetical protein